MKIKTLLKQFLDQIRLGKIEIYNEASIQYELAIFLRPKLKKYNIQLERNITYFDLPKDLPKENFEKKEIDIVIFNKNKTTKTAIELKFPTNGQYPEQMFSFIKDIRFLEQLNEAGFKNNLFLAIADDKNFWSGKSPKGSIYEFYRGNKKLQGKIRKPTGTKDKIISLKNSFKILWNDLDNEKKYILLEV